MPRTALKATCALCGASVGKRQVAKHVAGCAPAHDVTSGSERELVGLRVGALGAPEYWLELEAAAQAPLARLDDFLRDIWLECCGHLSMFEIPPFRYMSFPSEPGPFGRNRAERSMRVKIGQALTHVGQKGTHDYDFGSTTRLTLEVTGLRPGRIGRKSVRLLVRNDPLSWTCGVCDSPATLVCCAHETEDSPFVCAAHESDHQCNDAMFLPVVNSPRMGVCGYAG